MGQAMRKKHVEREILGQKGLHRYLLDLRAAFNSEMGDGTVLQKNVKFRRRAFVEKCKEKPAA